MHATRLGRIIGVAALAATSIPAQARMDPAMERRLAGVCSNACGQRAQPEVKIWGDETHVVVTRTGCSRSSRPARRRPR